jgi:hypothetical protein
VRFLPNAQVHMRPRVQRAPGLSCALSIERDKVDAAIRAWQRRENAKLHLESRSPDERSDIRGAA